MKRFIDLRGQHMIDNFAWYDTVRDVFETHSDNQTWDNWEEFVLDYKGDEIARYKSLTPTWAFKS